MLSVVFRDKTLQIGDQVRVKYTIIEGEKSRVQAFEGILIRIKGRGDEKTFTVRKIGDRGIGVERIWPVNSRSLIDIEVIRQPKKVRRSKLYYLRDLTGKMATRV